jgi:hypothetical protein
MITFSDSCGNLINVTHFGISTGDKAGFYTLRAFGVRTRYTQTEFGTESESDDTSVYIRNLSTDKEQALEAAKAYLSKHYPFAPFRGVITFDLDDIHRISREQTEANRIAEAARIASTDFSIFQGGKYAGQSVNDVLAEDKAYCEWFSGNFWSKESDNARTAAIINAILAPERNAAAAATEDRVLALKQEIGKPTLIEWFNGNAGGFCQSIVHGLGAGKFPTGRGLEIVLDILAKWAGRTGSKDYKARLAELEAKFN